MKLILSSVVLTTLVQSSRLLQQTDACSTVRCGVPRTECYVNPVNTDIAICCEPDDLCATADYQSTEVAICMDDGGVQKYDNKCLGRCDGNDACGQLCTCDTDADCATGFSCLETPFGFAGCDQNTGNSCFGFCTIQRQGACGGFVGPAGCNADETCFLDSTESNALGSCYSLPDTCPTPQVTPSPTVCGSIENCAVFSDGCNTCDCGVDGSATTDRCTEIACKRTVPFFCDTCATGYEKDATTGECVEIPTCGGVENCAAYSTGCSNCECATDGTETCTRINTCEPDLNGELTICHPCDPLAPPYSCDTCADGYYLDGTGGCTEIPTCGGIDFCSSFTADSCGNVCSCLSDTQFPICTLIACGIDPPSFQPTCNGCVEDFKPSDDGLSCEPDLGCFCPLVFDPVCCDGTTYGNSCQANCAGCSGITTEGACPTTCAATTCPVGQKCVELGVNGAKCVDEDVCCTPLEEVLAENPFACFEGCACCPDGTWSGSIGDGKTFCGGLVQGVDEFGTECGSTGIDTVECVTKNDCDPGYKCRKDPICRIDASIKCRDVSKVCVDYKNNNGCSSDGDCDTYNGEICLLANGIGICVDYQSPSTFP